MKRVIFLEGKKKPPKKFQHLLFRGESTEEFLKDLRDRDEIIFQHHDRLIVTNLIYKIIERFKDIELIRQ